jgi:hypothetical protein
MKIKQDCGDILLRQNRKRIRANVLFVQIKALKRTEKMVYFQNELLLLNT